MGFRSDLRTRLQVMQAGITGLKRAALNVPPSINNAMCPLFVNFFFGTTYTSLQGQGAVTQASMSLTMRLYLGAFNTVTAMEDTADEMIPLVEALFVGNNLLMHNNAPLNIQEFRMLTNSGLTSQQYVVPSEQTDVPYYAVVEFPATVSYIIRNC